MVRPRISSVRPLWAIEGGRIVIFGSDLISDTDSFPEVQIGTHSARITCASSKEVEVLVPSEAEGGHMTAKLDGATGETVFVEVGQLIATGFHQVDSPVIDRDGNLYLTCSGARGEASKVSLFRVGQDGFREPYVTGITNPTSMALSPDGCLYVSSRFEGMVYKVDPDGTYGVVASDLGVACGLAFSPDGTLYIGDRSGNIFRAGIDSKPKQFATLPASVAAFHLAWGPDDALYVTAPTLASRDTVYRIGETGQVDGICSEFGRPQGLAFDANGDLYVVEALAGMSGVYKVESNGSATSVLSARSLVGLAFDPRGGLVVVSSESAYRLNLSLRPF